MRIICILAFVLIEFSSVAQIEGNKNIQTKTFPLDKTEIININLYADILIDCGLEENITITADENLMNLINKSPKEGVLNLYQLDWIRPSSQIKITIGAPSLKALQSDTHGQVKVSNMDQDSIRFLAPIGKIQAQGKADYVFIHAKNGSIDASNLAVENALITLTGNSETKVQVLNQLIRSVGEDASLQLVNEPKLVLGDTQETLDENKIVNSKVEWIDFKIKNNSWNRNKFVVVGPKKDGGRFSYGFAMMPGLVKKERWSVGSKVYREKGLGVRQLVATITDEDEGKTVKLFSIKE